MHNRLRMYLILGVAINTVLFSGFASALSFNQFDLRLDGIGVSVDGNSTSNPRMFYSLGKGFTKAQPFNPVLKYNKVGNYVFECGGVKLKSGETCHFGSLKYGDSSQVINLYKGATLSKTYKVIFTNLPVVDITTVAKIVDAPKVKGTIRVMSAEFNQDTGVLPMGVETAGQTAQLYREKPYDVQIGTSLAQWNVAKNEKLLDLPARDDWRLDPAYRDATKVRNMVVQDLYRDMHINTDPNRPKASSSIRGHLTEVVLNGSYQGVYVLEEKVDRALLDLKKPNVPKGPDGQPDWDAVDFSQPENSSVLYKANYELWHDPSADPGALPTTGVFFFNEPGDVEVNFSVSYPKSTSQPYYDSLMTLVDFVVNSDDATFTKQIGNLVDLKSVANWWLLVQLSQGRDNEGKNFFIAKNAGPTPADRKFFIVPWDGDATFGMFWNGTADVATSYVAANNNNLVKRLLENPTGFNTVLKSQWASFRQGSNAPLTDTGILARFASYDKQLTMGGARARDTERWPKPDDKGVGQPKFATAKYIRNFLNVRLPAMDRYINGL